MAEWLKAGVLQPPRAGEGELGGEGRVGQAGRRIVGKLSNLYAPTSSVRSTWRRAVRIRRDGRVVEGGGLENRCAGNRTLGSNPSPSAN